ncbi:MAG TPA: hypothetical protein VMZ90_15530, partial [Vicinamibacterales bacterium]|nr:hypothetical protein [Vicinamibacterales bacterium]
RQFTFSAETTPDVVADMQYACGMSVRLIRTVALLALLVLGLLVSPVAAQVPTPTPTPPPTPTPTVAPLEVAPLPFFVVDLRFGFASLGSDTTTAAGLGVLADDMPSRAKTVVAGAHVYLVRQGGFKLGVGAEAIRGASSNQRLDATGKGTGPIIHRGLEGITGQLSLNFGKGKGWSYITAGGGPMKFDSYLDEAKPTRPGATTLNYGGGARWFARGHLAVTVDVRFYLLRPALAAFDAPPRIRKRVTLLSAGVSIK